ncbi:MAG: discoidin domain-containing protein [Clostridia bacterium]|nr:discoidin domain-containing protein [Clostridia bacterium]
MCGYEHLENQLSGGWNKESAKFPTVGDCRWETLTEVIGTRQTDTYFIITAKAGEQTEEFFVSFPAEGGLRLQCLHGSEKAAGQTIPSVPAAGLFEPSSLKTISYQTAVDGTVMMTAADGTVICYEETAQQFTLWICDADGNRIVPIGSRQIVFAYGVETDGLVVHTVIEMPLAEQEAIVMGSQTANTVNQVGDSLLLTVIDTWGNGDYMYMVNPLYHSNRGYSMWCNMPYMGVQDCGESDPTKMILRFDSTDTSIKMDIRFWAGTPLENLKKYTDVTGRSGVSPTWSYSYWSGACDIAWRNVVNRNPIRSDEPYENVVAMLEEYHDTYGFYPKVLGVEHHGENMKILDYLAERGIRPFDWFHPSDYDEKWSKQVLADKPRFPTLDENGKAITPGYPFAFEVDENGECSFPDGWRYFDFSNPYAYDVVKALMDEQHGYGVNGFMTDFGEWSNTRGTYFNGLTATGEMHNLMAYYYAKTLHDVHRDRFGGDYVIYQRSGTPGTQKFTGNFLGDPQANWRGYMHMVHMMIGLGAGGWNLYGGDLACHAFIPSNDLWNRAVPLGVFSPYFRKHGQSLKFPASDYDALARKSFGGYYYFRENIVPTIESAAIKANKTADPIIKGMMIAYPKQLPLADIDNQYLFCDDFLVCAVTKENVCFQQVALPKGSAWYDLYSYKAYRGGQVMYAEAPAGTLPVFLRGGAVKAIHLPSDMKLGTKMFDDSHDGYQAIPALLVTAPDRACDVTIYVKDGESTDYQTYDSHTETYVSKPTGDNTFSIANKDGSSREILLALGVTAAAVKVDGTPLTYLAHTPDYAKKEYGYTVDRRGMTTIYVKAGWKEITVTQGDAAYVPYKLTAVSHDACAMLDGKAETQFVLPQDGAPVTVALENAAKIGRVVVKWTTGFYAVYDIAYSLDGEQWTVLPTEGEHTVIDGAGSIDVIDFETVDAAYLRIQPVQIGDNDIPPAIYGFEVYAPACFAPLEPLSSTVKKDENGNASDNWTESEWNTWNR